VVEYLKCTRSVDGIAYAHIHTTPIQHPTCKTTRPTPRPNTSPKRPSQKQKKKPGMINKRRDADRQTPNPSSPSILNAHTGETATSNTHSPCNNHTLSAFALSLFPPTAFHPPAPFTCNDSTYLVNHDPSLLARRVSSSGGTKGSASADTMYPVARVALSL
jgi:hypothetical protein